LRPVLFESGPFHIQAYTVCMLAAVIIGGWLTYREAERRGRLNDDTLMVGLKGLVGGVIGAKLSMVVFLGPVEFWR
jgi:prolipoprotein diacylglyceryltransferase